MPDAIVIRGVRKTFGSKVAVENLDLTIPEGGIYGFIGPNGAGKTTTLRMIMSIYFADRGEIRVLGKKSALESKDRIGYLPEERGLYRKMKVGAFLTYMARLKGVDSAGLAAKVRDWLARVALADCEKRRCQELSKGMQQKVQFLSALIHEPDLIILDEPFSGLDPMNARLMRDLIHGLEGEGKTIIFSTHVMQHAEQICDHIVMINRGRKVLDAPIGEIYARADARTVVVEPLALAADFSRIPGVREAVKSDRNGDYELHLEEGASPAEVMRAVVQATPIRRIELKRPTLEDVFIETVQKAEHVSAESVREALHAEAAGAPGAELGAEARVGVGRA
ncbi:MAG: ATP-binding cassette domain-containing protein [Phycisphaerales bacterium]